MVNSKKIFKIIIYFGVCSTRISSSVVFCKQITKIGIACCTISCLCNNVTCTEVYIACQCGVNTSQIKNQLIEPEVIVTCKFKYNIVSPCVLAARCLYKACTQFHSVIVVGSSTYCVQLFILSGVSVSQYTPLVIPGQSQGTVQVFGIFHGINSCCYSIIRQKLPVL